MIEELQDELGKRVSAQQAAKDRSKYVLHQNEQGFVDALLAFRSEVANFLA